jgi:DNA-binding LacI/PurR family transcriptional regulator
LFASRKPPDAIICANDITAISLLKSLASLKIRVPRDCLVAGVDDVRLAALSNPPLTTVGQPCREIGRAAVLALIERIRNPSIPPRQIFLDAQLVMRKSTTR